MSAALGDPITHIWLMRRMAAAQGVDLAEAQAAGRLSQEGWAAMVTRCRGCADPEDCARRLERGDPGLPGYCRNGRALGGLAGEGRDG